MIFSKGSLFWGAVSYTPDDAEGFARDAQIEEDRKLTDKELSYQRAFKMLPYI